MENRAGCAVWQDALPLYAAGSLDAALVPRLGDHLAGCATCRRAWAEWQEITRALAQEHRHEQPPLSFEDSWAHLAARLPQDAARQARWRGRLQHLGLVIGWQGRLLHPALWPCSLLAIILVVLCSVLVRDPVQGTQFLSVMVPLVIALGMGFVCDPRIAHDSEIAQATITAPRTVLLIRCGLVGGADVALGLAATLVLARPLDQAVTTLAMLWLSPALLLAALNLLAALLWNPQTAAALIATICGTRLAQLGGSLSFAPPGDLIWQVGPQTLACAVMLFALAIFIAPHRTAWRGAGYRAAG